jgi:small conductance mechanosensitive channel
MNKLLSQQTIDIIWNKVSFYTPNILMGIITLLFGLYLAKILTKGFSKFLEKKLIDSSLHGFLSSIVGILLKVLVVLTTLGIFGIETTSFVAILGSAGLAVGLALQGSLANFAGGVLIIIFRPFKVGDFIDVQGVMGSVSEISVFQTKLLTPDNKVILVPNGPLAGGTITNFSAQPLRRVDLTFGIGYDDDLKKAKELIFSTVTAHEKVLKDPAPFIAVSELADSSVNFVVRVWAKTEDYWNVHFDSIENVKLALDENGVSIPYPQSDLHIKEIAKQ